MEIKPYGLFQTRVAEPVGGCAVRGWPGSVSKCETVPTCARCECAHGCACPHALQKNAGRGAVEDGGREKAPTTVALSYLGPQWTGHPGRDSPPPSACQQSGFYVIQPQVCEWEKMEETIP